jgi:hypothetical protein
MRRVSVCLAAIGAEISAGSLQTQFGSPLIAMLALVSLANALDVDRTVQKDSHELINRSSLRYESVERDRKMVDGIPRH